MRDWSRAFELIRARGFPIEPGLTAAELARAEERFAIRFPLDLAEFLRLGLPSGDRFPQWRSLDASIEAQLAWPLEGMLFDIQNAVFWMPEWGQRPSDVEAAKAVATAAVRAAPALIPLCGHRYLPAEPLEAGNPVLSVTRRTSSTTGTTSPRGSRPSGASGTSERSASMRSDRSGSGAVSRS